MEIRFLSNNTFKIAEVDKILSPVGITIVPSKVKIEELQTEDVERLVRDKLLQAFKIIGRPVFVEHTGIYLNGLNGFPGGLTQIFWDRIGAESFVSIVSGLTNMTLIAKTVVGYCDGKNMHYFEGEISGKVPTAPRVPEISNGIVSSFHLAKQKLLLRWVIVKTISR